MKTMLNNFEIRHLHAWIENTFLDDEQETKRDKILSFLNDYPDLVKDHSWREILTLAERAA